MLIITIRTDKPEAEIGLYEDLERLEYTTWQAHRELSNTLHCKMRDLLQSHDKDWADLKGIVCFKGPGSFTGLRIGISAANALAGGLDIPIISKQGDSWIEQGLQELSGGGNDKIVLPEYGALPNTTLPRK